MLGLMQDWPLTVDKILDHAKLNHGDTELVTRTVEGPIVKTTYAQLHERSKQVSSALYAEGLKQGDVVGAIAWNTVRHMETWYGAMGVGMVMHTMNPRLLPQQIAQLANHAEDKLLFLDLTFVPILEQVCALLPKIKRYVILTDAAHMPKTTLPGAVAYEDWIAGQSKDVRWGGFPEDTACALCYTSGTTGDPKGVLYSHRSNVLHALMIMQRDAIGLSASEIVLPIVPMFHANAWGIVFGGPAAGSSLVFPGAKLDGPSICELLNDYEVSLTCGVPTVALAMLQHLEATNGALPKLKRLLIGGAAASEAIVAALEDQYGVEVLHGWGMTEMSPLGAIGSITGRTARLPKTEQRKLKLKQGRAPFMVEMKIVDDDSVELPRDSKTSGHLLVRGPAIASGYLKVDGCSAFQDDGFFDTGDIATIDALGYMQITDRAKDLIKSGGEWISSVEIETIALGAPGVAYAAVIGIPDPKWDERPLLIIEPKPGEMPEKAKILQHLEGKIAKWWMPAEIVLIDKIPLGPTGKINKLALREQRAGLIKL
jgi:fatty-acyl-CoA synthase